MSKILSDKAKAFLAKQPTLIGRVAGYSFYEHPTKGDESPLIVISPEGQIKLSDYYELPSFDDLFDRPARKAAFNEQAPVKMQLLSSILKLNESDTDGFTATLSRNLTSKKGVTLYKGTAMRCDFSPINGLYQRFRCTAKNGETFVVKYEIAHTIFLGFKPCPTVSTLERQASTRGMCSTPLGNMTDMDGTGVKGEPSWMLVLGVV